MDSLINTFFDLWGINLSTELRNAIVAIFSIFTMLALLYLILKIASPRASSFRTYAIKYCSIIVAILVSLTYYSTLGIDIPSEPDPEEPPVTDSNLFVEDLSELGKRYSSSSQGLVNSNAQTVVTNPITINLEKNIEFEGIDVTSYRLWGFYTSSGELTIIDVTNYTTLNVNGGFLNVTAVPNINNYETVRIVGIYTDLSQITITYADISA